MGDGMYKYPVEELLYVQKHYEHVVPSSKLQLVDTREVYNGVLSRQILSKARHLKRQGIFLSRNQEKRSSTIP